MSINGKHFDNSKFRDLCVELGIKNYYSSPTHPHSNGQAEVTIRTLKVAMKTKLEDLKGKWVEYLPKVLWAHRTTRKSTTQETPFALAFGTEAVAPVEVRLKSPRRRRKRKGGIGRKEGRTGIMEKTGLKSFPSEAFRPLRIRSPVQFLQWAGLGTTKPSHGGN